MLGSQTEHFTWCRNVAWCCLSKNYGSFSNPTLHGKGWVMDLLLGFLAKISAELMPK